LRIALLELRHKIWCFHIYYNRYYSHRTR